MTTRHKRIRTVTFALAVLCLGSVVKFLQAQTPAVWPASASKVLIEAPLGEVAQQVTMTSLAVPQGTTVSEHSQQGPVFAYVLEANLENQVIAFTVGETGKAEESAKPSPAITTLLQEQVEVANREGRLSILTLEPGWWGAGFQGGGVHQHPGPIFAYILKGAIESQVDPDPAKIYRAGDVFYEPQMHAHRLFRNTSPTEPAELLMFQVFDKGAPTATGVK
jgi:quercetin dioxygenase-like cupin family protein